MTTIRLAEHAVLTDVALSAAAAHALQASKVVTLTPTRAPGRWQVRGKAVVGAAWVGPPGDGVELWVTPKVPVDRLFFLLGYSRVGIQWRDRVVDLDEQPDLLSAVAEAFSRQADRALRQGVLQGYHQVEDALPVLRGRLREREQVRRRHGLMVPLEVTYDEFSVDIAENRLILAASRRLLRMPGISASTRHSLQRTLLRLSGVEAPADGQPLPRWQPSRLNGRYHVALPLAELVLRGGSFDLRAGSVRVEGFLVDMNKAFEDFVVRALQDALRPYGGRCVMPAKHDLDVEKSVKLEPDLVWYRPDGTPGAVVDAKYKAEKNKKFPNADAYQMLAYCTALGLPRGHLIYAAGGDAPPERTIRRTGMKLLRHVLPLDRSPGEVLAAVAELADLIAGPPAHVPNG
ncbi:restriction endonuclease [Embleya sp. NPDC005575]|uniref:McrC family protein n=1 Tax=Embleya sp. NPDC005575 TaxID=3156892 RepID=UPI0033AAA609